MSRTTVILAAALVALAWSVAPRAAGQDALAAYYAEDFETAAREFAPLAERGDADAQYRLGLMYDYGQGVEKDPERAAELLRAAAAQDHVEAQFALGLKYMEGIGVAFNPSAAHYWVRQAANRGHLPAQHWLPDASPCQVC